MKNYLQAFTIFISITLLSIACRKDVQKGPDYQGKLLESVTIRKLVPGGIDTISMAFEYDRQGRLIRYVNGKTNLAAESYEYGASIPSRIIKYAADGSITRTLDAPFSISANGDTIVYTDRHGPINAPNIFRETYIFRDSVLTELRSYHLRAGETTPRLDVKWVYQYDDNGNVRECLYDGGTGATTLYSILSVDNRRNFRRSLSRINYILIKDLLEENGRSVNNITALETPSGARVEYEWTYDTDGYPLTCRRKNDNTILYEWKYR